METATYDPTTIYCFSEIFNFFGICSLSLTFGFGFLFTSIRSLLIINVRKIIWLTINWNRNLWKGYLSDSWNQRRVRLGPKKIFDFLSFSPYPLLTPSPPPSLSSLSQLNFIVLYHHKFDHSSSQILLSIQAPQERLNYFSSCTRITRKGL